MTVSTKRPGPRDPLITIERVALLHGVEFFRRLPGHVLAAVAQKATERELEAGQILMAQGDAGDCLFVVIEGRVRVEAADRVLGELHAGDVVGELAVLSPGPRSATVTTMAPTLVLRVGADVIDELLLDHPEVTRSIIEVLVRRLRPTPTHDIAGTPDTAATGDTTEIADSTDITVNLQ